MPRARIAIAAALCALASHVAAAGELRTLRVGGLERAYRLHEPALWPGPELPLVLVLHGSGGNPAAIESQTGFSEEADWRGFAVAYPAAAETSERRWNAGTCCGSADDVAFLRAVVDDAASLLPIDRRRVYAAGLSNGGMMAYRLACEAGDSFAAVGVVAGALIAADCAPAVPVSVIHVHGTRDALVPLTGGPGALGLSYPTTDAAIELWLSADGCDPTPELAAVLPDVVRRRHARCRAGTAVELYRIADGKHTWPGGNRLSVILPPPPRTLDTTRVLWEFFESHPKE